MVLKISDLTGSSLTEGFQTLPSEISLNQDDFATPVSSAAGGKNKQRRARFDLPNILENLMQGGSIFTKDELSGDAGVERGILDNIAQRQNVFAAFGLLNFLEAFSPGGVKGKKDKKDIIKTAGGIDGKGGKKKKDSGGSNNDEEEIAAAERESIFNGLPDGLQMLIKSVPEFGEAFETGEMDLASKKSTERKLGGPK